MNTPALVVYFVVVLVQVVGLLLDYFLIKYCQPSISEMAEIYPVFSVAILVSQALVPVSFAVHIYAA